MKVKSILMAFLCIGLFQEGYTQEKMFTFGTEVSIDSLVLGGKGVETEINWINVNTALDTWSKDNELLICTGLPIGVVRSEKQYENFILSVEWRHMELGGNSGIFVWSDAIAGESNRLPGGVEVQMLELDWVNQHSNDSVKQPIAYVHGELFGVGGVETIPDTPRGNRSQSIENRALGKGEWNSYHVVCVDGTIKLSVNGKFVNGIRQSSIKKGYLCLESEGAEIQFRNFKLIELPPGVTSEQQAAAEII